MGQLMDHVPDPPRRPIYDSYSGGAEFNNGSTRLNIWYDAHRRLRLFQHYGLASARQFDRNRANISTMDLRDKQKYYEYDIDGGGDWWVKNPPFIDPSVQARLTAFAGLSEGVRPLLRIEWGGTVMHDMTIEPQLKYKVVREVISGYYYQREDGSTGETPSMNLPADAKVPWEFAPKHKRLELGRLRWVIEKHVPAHELERLGRFQHRAGSDGKLILKELPAEGIYQAYFWIQTAAHKYRDPDPEVITAVEAMWKYNITHSEAEKALHAMEAEANKTLIGAQEARQMWNNLT